LASIRCILHSTDGFFTIEPAFHTCYPFPASNQFFASQPIMPPRNNRRRRPGGRGRRRDFGPKKKDDPNDEEKAVEVEGEISSVLAGTMFRVKLASGHEVLAHISGKMRKRFIRLVVGDRVKMEMSPYDLTKARIVFRLS
jgi:translation initiation factor IF-1